MALFEFECVEECRPTTSCAQQLGAKKDDNLAAAKRKNLENNLRQAVLSLEQVWAIEWLGASAPVPNARVTNEKTSTFRSTRELRLSRPLNSHRN